MSGICDAQDYGIHSTQDKHRLVFPEHPFVVLYFRN